VRVLDLTRRTSPPALEIVPCLPCEMLTQLNRATWEEGAGTYEEVSVFDDYRTNVSPRLASAIEQLGGGGKPWGSLNGLALRDPPALDVPSFLSRVEETSARELRLIVLGSHVSSLRDLVGSFLEAAADGDQEAMHRLLEADPMDGPSPAFHRLLSLDMERAKALTLEVLGLWNQEVFAPRMAEIRRVVERDVAAKRALVRELSLEQVVERATNGLQYAPLPGIRRVVLVPHIAMRPWNLLNEWDDTYLILYPAADESLELDRAEPPARLVRLYRALDDPKRLRILKLLYRGPAGLQEIADHVGVAKSTAHHHMVILRAAGLTRVGTDYSARYSLRPERLGDTGGWLEAFVTGEEPS
jgi:DNA-binding transcriptional ArsR family regulator